MEDFHNPLLRRDYKAWILKEHHLLNPQLPVVEHHVVTEAVLTFKRPYL